MVTPWRRWALYGVLAGLLLVVAAAAAVLSFEALRDLAVLVGYDPSSAWLFPITADAGAAAGTVVWLTTRWLARTTGRDNERALRFGRWLALVLLGSSVVGNAVSHGLRAYGVNPPWWLVVLVSALPPAVLGAVVHLAVLVLSADPAVVRAGTPTGTPQADSTAAADPEPPADPPADETFDERAARLIAEGYGRTRLTKALDIEDRHARRLLDQHRNGST